MRASSRKLVSALAGGLALLLLWATAAGAQDSSAVTVTLGSYGVTFEVGPVPHFVRMTVRVVDPAGEFVVNAQSFGEPVSWVAGPGAREGHYRYEAVVVTEDPTAPAEGDEDGRRGAVRRRAGTFRVSGGVIIPPRPRTAGSQRP